MLYFLLRPSIFFLKGWLIELFSGGMNFWPPTLPYWKKGFWKIRAESQVITKKLSKIGIPNETIKIWHIFADILGLGAYFSKPIFALKPWDWAGRFEYHEKSLFFYFFLPERFLEELALLKIIEFMVFKSTGSIPRFQQKNWFWKIRTKFKVMTKKLSKIGIPIQTSKIWHIFDDISGFSAMNCLDGVDEQH